jgi:hypothetical protein
MASRPTPWPRATARSTRSTPPCAARWPSFYPQVKNIRLTDYKVRILDSATGTAAKTRVLIQSSDGRDEWGTVGVSGNIIEASLQALVDSILWNTAC